MTKPRLIAVAAVCLVAAGCLAGLLLLQPGQAKRRPVPMLANGTAAPAPVLNPAVQSADRRRAHANAVLVARALDSFRQQHHGFSGLTVAPLSVAAPQASAQVVYAKAGRVCVQTQQGDQIFHVTESGAVSSGVCPAR